MFLHAIKKAASCTPLELAAAATSARQAAWLPGSAKRAFLDQARADIFVGASMARKGLGALAAPGRAAGDAPKSAETILGAVGATLGLLVGLGHGVYRAFAYWLFAPPQAALAAWLQALDMGDMRSARRAENKLANWSGLNPLDVSAARVLAPFIESSSCPSQTRGVNLFKYAKEAPCGAQAFFANAHRSATLLQGSPWADTAPCQNHTRIWLLPPPPETQARTKAVDHTPCTAWGVRRLNVLGQPDTAQKLRRIQSLWPVVKIACEGVQAQALERMLYVGDGAQVSDYALVVAGLARSFYVAAGAQSRAHLAAYVHVDRLPEQIWRRIYDFCDPQTLGNLASTHREAQIDISRRLSLKVDALNLCLPFCLTDAYKLHPSPVKRNQAALAIARFHHIATRSPAYQAQIFGRGTHTQQNPLQALRGAEPNTVIALTPKVLPFGGVNPAAASGRYAVLRIDGDGHPTLRTNMD